MRRIPVNELNQPLGESRRNCKYPDALVSEARDLYEYHNLMPAEIARKMGVPYSTVRAFVYYKRRATLPRNWRTEE